MFFKSIINCFIPIFTGYACYLPSLTFLVNSAILKINTCMRYLDMSFKLNSISIPTEKLVVDSKILRQKLQSDTKCEEYEIMTGNFKLISIYSTLCLVFTNMGIRLLTNSVGFIYPLYLSIKGLKKNDDRNWLVYWLIYASYCYLESMVGVVLEIIPFYHYLKLASLIFLVRSETLTDWIYNKTLFVIHKQYEDNIDNILKNARSNLDNIQSDMLKAD